MFKKYIALLAFPLACSANAAMLDYGNFTRDTSTGLDWLDLTETQGPVYSDIVSMLGDGQELEGWRFATIGEINTLWTNFGFQPDNLDSIYDSDEIQKGVDAVSMLGNTYGLTGYPEDIGTMGWTLEAGSNPYVDGYAFGLIYNPEETPPSVTLLHLAIDAEDGYPFFGAYLVKPAPVPVPAAIWLFGSGLLCFAGLKRRK